MKNTLILLRMHQKMVEDYSEKGYFQLKNEKWKAALEKRGLTRK